MIDALNRRHVVLGGVATLSTMTALGPESARARDQGILPPQSLDWSGPRLLDAFAKARSSLKDEFTIGWMDATTFAVINGETSPFYRLLAATWQRHRRVSDTEFEGQVLEVAFYLDVASGERLQTLTMPRTSAVVTVPNYRAGPSKNKMVIRESKTDEFRMAQETTSGSSFFATGTSQREQYLSQPQRAGDDFLIRQTLGTRVLPSGSTKPSFFYHEWTVNRSSWKDINNARLTSCAVEVQYSSIAAFRPWMKMSEVDGHTLQNGRGGKALTPTELPPQLLALCKQYHPDLLDNPAAVFDRARS
jgi:hypothetical protein